MAIEIIPKKSEEKISSVEAIFRYIGLGLLLVLILVSVVLLLLTWRMSQKTEDIKAEIEYKKSPEILLLEGKMKGHHQRVLDFAYILDNRVSPVPMFEIIERNMHPEVFLSDLQIDVAEKTIRANGVATDIVAFDQQKKLFERDEMITSSGIDAFTRGDDGRVSFPMTITFSNQLFNLDNGR